MKLCKTCNVTKEYSCFYKRGETSYQHKCIDCETKYKLANKERIANYKSNHYLNNKESYLKKAKESKKRNNKAWYKKYYTEYPEKRIVLNMRNRISSLLRGEIKNDTTINLLGCNVQTLKKHLQSNFTKGMKWNNYGMWHVDHIIPCAKFDLKNEEEQKICFHYTNLQPLWAKDNCSKQDKLTENIQLNIIL
jgi:hypothetical protein